MRYHFKIHKEKGGFWAEGIELPGCVTQGNSKKELLDNIKDAINTYLEEPAYSKYLAPLPKKSISLSPSVIEIPVDPTIAFAYSIRRQRIKNGLTQKEAATKLGLKGIYSYQRLEKKCNPTLEMIMKLLLLFPTLSLDKTLR